MYFNHVWSALTVLSEADVSVKLKNAGSLQVLSII